MDVLKLLEERLGTELSDIQLQTIVDHYSVENGNSDSQEKQTL